MKKKRDESACESEYNLAIRRERLGASADSFGEFAASVRKQRDQGSFKKSEKEHGKIR